MASSVICISRVNAAGGEVIGQVAARELGFRYVDDEVITVAAERAGLDSSVLASAEQHRGLLSRIMGILFAPGADREGYFKQQEKPIETHSPVPSTLPGTDELRRLIKEAVVAIANRGNVVIVAHGASLALRGRADALRVHVTASLATRVQRLWVPTRLVSEDEYMKAMVEADRQRAKYLANFYGVEHEEPTLYDLVINTDTLDFERAAAGVVEIAKR